jgi:hypothetical protein
MSEWFYGTCVTCNFIYVHKTSVAVPALSFTKLTVHNSIMCRSLRANFIWMRQYVWKIWTGIHLYPYVKYGFHCTSICEHHDHSNFCVCLYQILSILGGKYHVYPSVKYKWHSDDVRKISCIPLSKVQMALRRCSQHSSLLQNYLYSISWKSDTPFSCWY